MVSLPVGRAGALTGPWLRLEDAALRLLWLCSRRLAPPAEGRVMPVGRSDSGVRRGTGGASGPRIPASERPP